MPAGSPARAQTVAVAHADEPFFGDIGGPRLGQLAEGASFASGATRSGHTQLTLEGWVFGASLKGVNRDGHTLAVAVGPTENLRDAPNGHVLARLVQDFLLDELERRGTWVKVRRTVWVRSAAVRAATAATDRPAAPGSARVPASAAQAVSRLAQADSMAGNGDPRRALVRRRTQLYRAPDSAAIGQLEAGAPVRITARVGGWARIETQAWVRENEVRPTDAGILTGITAAELRSAPEEFRGRLLRWSIQFLSLQTADELRPDFAPGQKYILARGPAPEYAFIYVTVPAERLAEVQRIDPLSSVVVVARVVNGRSTYLANPILELVELP